MKSQFIKLFLQSIFVAKDDKHVWQLSSKERKPITLFGAQVTNLSFSELIPGTKPQQTQKIYTCWLNGYEQPAIDDMLNANNNSNSHSNRKKAIIAVTKSA